MFVTLSPDTASLNSVIFYFTSGSDFERIRGRSGSLNCNMFRCLNAAVAVDEPLPSAAVCSRGARRWRACCWCVCGEPRMVVVVVVVYLLEKSIITSQSCSCCKVCGVSSCVSFVSRPCRLDGWKNELFLQLVIGEMSSAPYGASQVQVTTSIG